MTDAHTNLLQNNNNENGIATPAISLPPKQYPFKGTLKDWQKSGSKISEMNNHFKNMGLEKRNIMNSSQSSSVSSGVSSLSDTSKSSSANFDSLPEGYEARLDNEGRIFYIDHINRKTTWNLPYIEQVTASSSSASSTSSSITSSLQSSANKVNLEEISYNYNRRTTVKSCLETNLLPSIAFLKRNDFAHVLQNNSNGLSLYNKSPYLKHMIQRIRKCEDNFDKFSKNIEMINFINAFADTTQPLPNGWQELRNQGNESFFANHISKSITPIDPRLPLELKKRTRSAPPINRNKKGGTTSQGPSTMAALIDKIEDIKVLVRTNYPDSAYRICKKLSLIAKIGESALLRFANDIDIISAISLFEQTQANGQSEDVPEDTTNNNNNELEDSDGGEFRDKVSYFYASINRAGYGQSPTKIKLLLRRFFLVEDSFQKIMSIDGMQLRKSQFTVSFEDEDGLDYGGPSRELFYLLSRDLFNPHFKLFEYSSGGVYTVTVSPKATEVSDYVRWFELCGRVLGLALIHRCLIDSFFPKPFYKILLGHSYLLDDLKEMDPLYWKSLNWISTNIITPDMDFTFTVTETVDNKVVDKELLVGGSNIKVTEYNKEEYIQCLLKWRIERGISKQIKALLRGLNDVIERDYLRVFDAAQLELMLSGTMEINLEDWRENCDYKGGYFDQHVVITWFWNTVYEMTNAERLKLLQFITGTASIPYEGFIGLRGSNGPKKFTIERWGESSSLPRAHTCFNRLDLPMYRDSKSLKEKLLLAINESSSYAIE
uniref:E3 ubiquitin-protein ligase n=1 Tax=Rhabditophanes sp. KR3021 TaxID=114890 RepID=A0AC35TR25_9BILA